MKSFLNNLRTRVFSLGHRLNSSFNTVKHYARKIIPGVKKAAMLAQGINRGLNLQYVSQAVQAVGLAADGASKILDAGENLQRNYGLQTSNEDIFR